MRLPTTVGRSQLFRTALTALTALPATVLLPRSSNALVGVNGDANQQSNDRAYQPALEGKGYGKSQMSYADFEKAPSGLMFKDAKPGKKDGKTPEKGDRVVIEWTGYTIGYYGRPFETKQLKELDNIQDEYLRFEVGGSTVIPAIQEGVLGMREGAVRQLVVPSGKLGYPESDPGHELVGPKPSTFSGQRALNFVLQNKELIDKTLLFNVKLVRVDKPSDKGYKAALDALR